jgi:hypothetical protein
VSRPNRPEFQLGHASYFQICSARPLGRAGSIYFIVGRLQTTETRVSILRQGRRRMLAGSSRPGQGPLQINGPPSQHSTFLRPLPRFFFGTITIHHAWDDKSGFLTPQIPAPWACTTGASSSDPNPAPVRPLASSAQGFNLLIVLS